ncbi:MAG: pyruvate dehydrogenase complex dihydrolipoyllysine-residue acetyltransferase [Cobetia sp.]|uniref:pyruvate dehydrogenase complex dihydrolipoyllysine-residue acetyltransferase n=3 Tax=Cobetia TaxID=204286 RepID=UPI000C4104A9|nr:MULTISPECIES: pyruvate dehydrogenase complex dihydrolipoyllysine-residue acetyltransferase [unclassified Cobetia]MBF09906.1 pyruvate dehydrogenase complex dihydrolipoyllysine-residue acetyltransferase [Cobetia sp.]MBK08645.1 pyruvate dehydrogenase complex dihydrolipoyllysine-residue acetyltransferase [Cobetia sp.]BBO57682.1 acetyltransferase component of pyruvate dehydrogenase complex [Cobetia sp. AM6]HAR08682.1 pyruvate dehydrogenase complex dihydrolipoyllysine-residue acetyltransferase [Co
MSSEIIKVPDIGGSSDVEIIEIAVAVGDVISAEDTMITLESDKASMDVPAPKGGKVVKILVKEGDTVSEGDDILELEAEGGGDTSSDASDEQEAPKEEALKQEASEQQAPKESAPAPKAASGGTQTVDIVVPDLGDSEAVPIIEMAVSEGDEVDAEDALITLESDKASMDVPSPHKGKIVKLTVKEGDSVASGDVIGQMEIAGEGGDSASDSAPAEQASSSESTSEDTSSEAPAAEEEPASGEPERKELRVPDLSGSDSVPIIEMAVAVGDEVNEEDALITLESDKATMDIPSPYKGKVVELSVKEGDTVSEGDLIGYIEVAGAAPAPKAAKSEAPAAPKAEKSEQKPAPTPAGAPSPEAQMAAHKPSKGAKVHAGPAVRLLAREFGVDLADVSGSGPKGRVVKEDVQAYVKQMMQKAKSAPAAPAAQATGGAGIPQVPDQDFSQFGEIEEKKMGRLMKAGATNLHRSWLNVPHVTQFDEADITELEAFRKSMKAEAEAAGAKLTPLPFMIKAAAHALAKYPQFNVSLKADGETLVHKKYVHIGIAVDTPDGLMVPVIRNADQKSLLELAKESVELAKKAQTKKLKREEMTGGCFTISSLGSIGGTAFTPIVNTPEVAILGVSKAQMKPVWDGAAFQPRLMMPLSLSYDHRAVNGADAARFTAYLAQVLTDVRRMLL